MSHEASNGFEVHVNGEPRQVPRACTVTRLISILGIEQRRIAVAINREVVPKSSFDSVELHGGDQVEILQAVGGG